MDSFRYSIYYGNMVRYVVYNKITNNLFRAFFVSYKYTYIYTYILNKQNNIIYENFTKKLFLQYPFQCAHLKKNPV